MLMDGAVRFSKTSRWITTHYKMFGMALLWTTLFSKSSPEHRQKLTKQDLWQHQHHILKTGCLLYQSHWSDSNCWMKSSECQPLKDWDSSHTHVYVTKIVDTRILHSLACWKSALRHQRHNQMMVIIRRAVKRAQIPAVNYQRDSSTMANDQMEQWSPGKRQTISLRRDSARHVDWHLHESHIQMI